MAQSETRAMRRMPVRVRLSEGLGRILVKVVAVNLGNLDDSR